MKYKIATPPATEPVTLSELKEHLGQVDFSDDDERLTGIITSARQWCEEYCRRAFITQTWTAYLDNLGAFDIPMPPLVSVSSIKYIDTDGVQQTLSSSVYSVDTAFVGRVTLAYNQSWPSVRVQENAVTVTFIAGYGAAAAVPRPIKDAILMQAEILYDRPDEAYRKTLQTTTERLLGPYRIR